MPLIGWIQYYKKQHNEKKLRELLKARGFEQLTEITMGALFYYSELNDREKAKFAQNANCPKEELERRFNFALVLAFRDLEIAELVTGNKEKALEANQVAEAEYAEYLELKKQSA